jgi:hypothetical protein
MGIALSHFCLALESEGRKYKTERLEKVIAPFPGLEYIATVSF